MSSNKCGFLVAKDQSAITGFSGDEVATSAAGGVSGSNLEMGLYNVAELVATSHPEHHVAPGPIIPVQVGDAAKL